MKTENILGNNRLIKKSITRMFPACFAATMALSISLMMDSLLAGSLIGTMAIAAVAIGNPANNIMRALVQTISNGAAVKITVNVGRGNHEEINRSYSLGVIGSFILGVIAIIVSITCAVPLANVFGGAGNSEIAGQATIYIITCSFSILFSSVNYFLGKVLSVYGYQKQVFGNALVSVIGNLVFSVMFVRILPENLAIGGLGFGTSLATLLCCMVSFTVVKVKKLPVKLKLSAIRMPDLLEVLKNGIPSSGNNLADGMVSGVVNNIILSGFGGDATALSVYTAVKGVATFAQATALGTSLATAPLFGILYGSRDKNGLKRTLREGYKVGLIFTVVWCVVLVALSPVLQRFYGMSGNGNVRTGIIACMIFMPVILAIRIMTQFFESTEKVGMGVAYSIIPDSVIFPLLILVLMPSMRYFGIWLAYGLNGLVFLLLVYIVRSIKLKQAGMSVDRMLCLEESIRDNVPMLDISIYADTKDISKLSTQVHEFMTQENVSERTAYMTALCLEELAVDFVDHVEEKAKSDKKKEILDIKLFSDDDSLHMIIRNTSKAYNPLDFDIEAPAPNQIGVSMIRKVARKITYSYVYKMNILTIDLDK